jgi:tetratricopeptide (TPR) repeat protein
MLRAYAYRRQGDELAAEGDLRGALEAYKQSVAALRSLVQGDSSARWAFDFSVGLLKLGAVSQARSDYLEALTAYQESLVVAGALAAREPDNVSFAKLLAAALTSVGDLDAVTGKRESATVAWEQGLAIRRLLATRDIENLSMQKDLALSLIRLGNARSASGGHEQALSAYNEAYRLLRRLRARGALSPSEEGIINRLEARGAYAPPDWP